MITSCTNKQIKEIMNLIKKSGDRHARGLFVIEGTRLLKEVPAELVDKIYATEKCAKESSISNCEIVSDEVMQRMADTRTPQGVLATVHMPKYSLNDIVGGRSPLVMVLENIQDPGNLGTIVRTCEGAGVSGIIMSKDTADIYNPKVVRSTMGSLFRVPFVYTEDIADTVLTLVKRGFNVYAANLKGSKPYTEVDYTSPSAILIGNEGNGLTDRLISLSTSNIRIPMGGSLESLNAAVSAAIIAYEARRQRDLQA